LGQKEKGKENLKAEAHLSKRLEYDIDIFDLEASSTGLRTVSCLLERRKQHERKGIKYKAAAALAFFSCFPFS